MACGGPDTKYAEPMLAHYHMLLDYMGWKERGSVLALGMLQAGAVKTSPPQPTSIRARTFTLRVIFSVLSGHRKKHMACRKKYKAHILK